MPSVRRAQHNPLLCLVDATTRFCVHNPRYIFPIFLSSIFLFFAYYYIHIYSALNLLASRCRFAASVFHTIRCNNRIMRATEEGKYCCAPFLAPSMGLVGHVGRFAVISLRRAFRSCFEENETYIL